MDGWHLFKGIQISWHVLPEGESLSVGIQMGVRYEMHCPNVESVCKVQVSHVMFCYVSEKRQCGACCIYLDQNRHKVVTEAWVRLFRGLQ